MRQSAREGGPPARPLDISTASRSARWILASLVVGAAFVGSVPVALAHGTQLTIGVEPSSIVAGGAVRVTGDLFGSDAIVSISLAMTGGSVTLSEAQAGPDGSLAVVVGIPAGVGPGTYELRVTDAGQVRDAPLVVTADPADGGPRPGQDEPFVVPTQAPAVAAGSHRTTDGLPTDPPAASVTTTAGAINGGAVVLLVAVVGVLSSAAIVLALRARRTSRRG